VLFVSPWVLFIFYYSFRGKTTHDNGGSGVGGAGGVGCTTAVSLRVWVQDGEGIAR